jgi:CRISPR-associated protein (TIGR03986 family)
MPGDFHNPYNFAPPADPNGAGTYKADFPDEHPLGQGRPAGHDRYRPGLWSGRIGIAIEAVTPLLIPEAMPVREIATGADKHKVYRTRRAPGSDDSTPLLPITSFKGGLRSAYEAVTNSRFGVFRGHGAPLARRMDAKESLQLVPGRVVNAKSGGFDVELLMGTTVGFPAWDQENEVWRIPDRVTKRRGQEFRERQPMYAAWLPAHGRNTNLVVPASLEHGAAVTIRLQQVERPPVSFWEVVALSAGHSGPGGLPKDAVAIPSRGYKPSTGVYSPTTTGAHHGYVCWNNKNIEKKHDERAFFSEKKTPVRLTVPRTVANQWRDLILDYKAVYARDGWTNKNTQPSRHIVEPLSEDLEEGTLCYVKLKRNEDDPNRLLIEDERKPIVEALFPVMIGRELGCWSPFEMLHEGLRPATSVDQLSPADRVFGWVRDESANRAGRSAGTSDPKPPAAWKGQLRIAPIRCGGVYDSNGKPLYENGRPACAIQAVGDRPEGLPLAILSTPKPSQARFYAACDKNGTPFENGANLRQKGYFEPRTLQKPEPQAGLRGRKVYPHHGAAGSVFRDYWDPAGAWADACAGTARRVPESILFREYVRRTQTEGQPKQDSQNRSVLDWVRPGTRFSTHVDVVNLNAAELGALLWLLDLGRKHDRQPPAHLRLGGGKPLGFGSVRVWITSLDLCDGEAKRQEYRSFLGISGAAQGAPTESGLHLNADEAAVGTQLDSPGGPVAAFKRAMKKAYGDGKADTFESLALIAAFLVAARGFDDALPLHYPRCGEHPDPDGNNYEWFVANQRQHGQKLSLPDITTDSGLPR